MAMSRTLDLNECAEFLNVHETTAQELASAGILPGAKIGRAWVFLEEDLVEYVRSEVRRQRAARQAEAEVSRNMTAAAARTKPTPLAAPAPRTRRKREYPPLPEVRGQLAAA